MSTINQENNIALKLSQAVDKTSKVKGFESTITVLHYNWGVSRAVREGEPSGNTIIDALRVTVASGAATPAMMVMCQQGKVDLSATLTVYSTMGEKLAPVIVFTLTNVLITRVGVQGSRGATFQDDEVELTFSEVKYLVNVYDGDKLVVSPEFHEKIEVGTSKGK